MNETAAPASRASAETRLRQRIDALLQRVAQCDPASAEGLDALAAVIALVRPRNARDADGALFRLKMITAMIAEDETRRAALRRSLLSQFASRASLRLFTDSGVLTDEGFMAGLSRRVGQRLMPEESDPSQLRDALRILFNRRDDHVWVSSIDDDCWIALIDTLDLRLPDNRELRLRMVEQMLEAMQVVSYRIAAIGLDPELVRNDPDIERYESPFVAQNVELRGYLEERRSAITDRRPPLIDGKHLLVLLDQCDAILARIRTRLEITGTNIRLTTLLRRVRDLIDRQRVLLQLSEAGASHEHSVLGVALFKSMVAAENRRHSLGEWFSQNTGLLAERITHNSGKTGEKYITYSPAEYLGMFRSAMGAGFFVAFMALVKIKLSAHQFAPIVQATLYSLNYSLGFVVIYLCHFTIATKQPAMTASFIARALDQPGKADNRLDGLAELIVCTARSQFIAVIGNVSVAFTLAILVAWAYLMQTGDSLISHAKSISLLVDTSPLRSLAVFHAAIAGVCLFLSGLIGGYYDNRAVYARIGKRLGQLNKLRWLLGVERAGRFGQYVGSRLGGIASNFFFGCMLGSMGALGTVLGLPLDIRHVTFSTANVGYALFVTGSSVPAMLAVEAIVGIFVIATTNLLVSFSLALFVAMRAQKVQFSETRALLVVLMGRLRTTPGQFFWPPRRDPLRVSTNDGG